MPLYTTRKKAEHRHHDLHSINLSMQIHMIKSNTKLFNRHLCTRSSLSMQEHLKRNNYIHNISIGRYSEQTSSIDEYNSKHQSQSKTCCCLIDRQQSKTSCNKRRY